MSDNFKHLLIMVFVVSPAVALVGLVPILAGGAAYVVLGWLFGKLFNKPDTSERDAIIASINARNSK